MNLDIMNPDYLGDGVYAVFDGTPTDIVRSMNETAFSPDPDPNAYMERFARHAKLLEGRAIRTASAADFLADLINEGLARIAPRAN